MRSAMESGGRVLVFLCVLLDLTSSAASAEMEAGTTGGTESRDYCLHESFNATCRPGFIILMTSAAYGRIHLGRCINGDYNIGCSMDVLTYFDSQCSARESCEISVRNLVDIHPCQRDFMSYLEASYRCIEVSALNAAVCPTEGDLRVSSPSGHIIHGPLNPRSTSSSVGTRSCPWSISARPGQRIQMKIIIIGDDDTLPTNQEETVLCAMLFVISDVTSGSTEVAACAGRSRERHLYTSGTSHVTLYMARDLARESSHLDGDGLFPRFILSYEAVGCPDLFLPVNAWSKRMGDNVMIKCNDTMETFYLTCQANRWIGEVGNCSHRGIPLVRGSEGRAFGNFPAHGIALAVLLGVALGIFIGMILLLTVHCARRRSISLKGHSIITALNKEKEQSLQDGGLRRNCSQISDANYPALIMNMEKIYDFDNHHRCRTCDHRNLLTHITSSPPQPKFRQQGSDYACAAHAHQCGTILRHCRCSDGASVESNLEREPLYDGQQQVGPPSFENFDLVTRSGALSTRSADQGGIVYRPGLQTPELHGSSP